MSESNFDYIIAGGGLAGLSLLYYIINDTNLKNKRVLVIDSVEKNQNDRTWCFWEKEKEFYEPLINAKWSKLKFESPTLSKIFQLREYQYKLIKSGDYYKFIKDDAKDKNVIFKTETIISIEDIENVVKVKTENNEYTASYAFNSTSLFNPIMTKENTLLQHFEGWFIKTEENHFDPTIGTLMDFTLSQERGIAFMYVLPISYNEALVEFTLFSESFLEPNEYKRVLENYISNKMKVKHYVVTQNEFGVIPMTKAVFKNSMKKNSKIINIGTAGGYTKASTGYTFKFVHKKLKKIVEKLSANKNPILKIKFREKMFYWYDMTLLDVLLKQKCSGEEVFTSLFKKNNPERVLAFLADESNHFDEFKIRNSVPLKPFMISGIKQLLPKRFNVTCF